MAGNEYMPYPAYAAPQRTYFPQPFAQQQSLQSGFTCRQVSSREEATTAQVPFDGLPYVFLNLSAGEVYIKQFNYNTGNTDFISFVRFNSAPEQVQAYATKEDIEALKAEISQLKKVPRRKEIVENE